MDLPGVLTFRDHDINVAAMLAATGTAARAVVIGGGLLGIGAARMAFPHRHPCHADPPDGPADGRQLDASRGALETGLGGARHQGPAQCRYRRDPEAMVASGGPAGRWRVLAADMVVSAVI